MSRIVITGIGVISSLGNTAEENRSALAGGASGIGKSKFVKSRYVNHLPFAEVKSSDDELRNQLNIFHPSITRTQLLAHHAFVEAVEHSTLSFEDLKSTETALVVASTVGGMYLTDELYHDANSATTGSPYIAQYDCASVTLYLQQQFGINGLCNTINTACSSGANAIIYGARLLQHKLVKRVVVGGVDCLSKFTINGFNALNILSVQPCKPFDRNRDGLNLGEGAAFVILENERDVTDKDVLAVLKGFANTNDAFHPSSLSDTGVGPTSAMLKALKMSRLEKREIDFINTHGTGTPNNDKVEATSMQNVFDKKVPPFISFKSKIGHTLGAASAIETVFSILSLMHHELYAQQNFSLPDEGSDLMPNTVFQKAELRNILINSFGFGGNCSSLVIGKN